MLGERLTSLRLESVERVWRKGHRLKPPPKSSLNGGYIMIFWKANLKCEAIKVEKLVA
jgi:hypothetical protein